MRRILFHLSVVLAYAGLTLVMTFPALLRLKVAIIGDAVDSLLNCWIIAWDIHKITALEFRTLFDANIFFPYPNTLAYSEHMLGVALLALPLQLWLKDPLLVYNLSILISFVLTAAGAYFLVRHLTGSGLAAFVAGLLFAFFPWRFSHLTHLQLLSAQWIPLTFLFLHQYRDSGSFRFLGWAGLFFILQFYSCGYYGLFLGLFVALFLLLGWRDSPEDRPRRLVQGLFFFLFSLLLLLPGFLPYWKLKRDFGFTRPFDDLIFFSADLLTFISAPQENRLWGTVLAGLQKPEGGLFPGIIPWVLAALGLAAVTVRRTSTPVPEGKGPAPQRRPRLPRFNSPTARFYGLMLVFSFLLCLGPVIQVNGWKIFYGPYLLLYKWVPGFDGLRAPARIVVMLHLAVSVLAGWGLAALLQRFRSSRLRGLAAFGITLLVLFEAASFPVRMHYRPYGQDFPALYHWLARQPEDFALLELPMPTAPEEFWREADYVYFSAFHWKKLVNGYSGFFPPGYLRFYAEGMRGFPSRETLKHLRDLGLRCVVVHFDRYDPGKREAIKTVFRLNGDLFTLERTFGEDWVYLAAGGAGRPADPRSPPARESTSNR
jgi:hypothetical protein